MKAVIKKMLARIQLTKCIALLIALMVILSILAAILSFVSTHHKSPLSSKILSIQVSQEHSIISLNQIQTQLNKLSQQMNTSQHKDLPALLQLNQRLSAIQIHLDALESKFTLNPLQQQLKNNHEQEMSQIVLLQKQLQKLKERAAASTHYLSSRTLPFQVIGMDEWNGQPQVTIKQNVYYSLMGQGDMRDEWTLIHLSLSTNQAIFKNKKNQLVKVNL